MIQKCCLKSSKNTYIDLITAMLHRKWAINIKRFILTWSFRINIREASLKADYKIVLRQKTYQIVFSMPFPWERIVPIIYNNLTTSHYSKESKGRLKRVVNSQAKFNWIFLMQFCQCQTPNRNNNKIDWTLWRTSRSSSYRAPLDRSQL